MKKTKKPTTQVKAGGDDTTHAAEQGATTGSREEAIADTTRQLKTLAGSLTQWQLTSEERETIQRQVKAALG